MVTRRTQGAAMIERYTRPAMGALWTEEAKLDRWLEVELALLEVLEARGEIPAGTAAQVRAKATVDPRRIEELEATLGHDVIAFLTALAEGLGPESRFVHHGMTSSDLLDTALALALRRGGDLLIAGIDRLRGELREQALRHQHTVAIGRTHGVHAEPVTLGLKFLYAYDELGRARARLTAGLAEASVGKLSGAVGTFAHLAPEIEDEVMRRLGLARAPISTQVVPRDRHAALLTAIAIAGASLERLATEIRNLQRTEVREVEEPFGRGQKGSSAMPHKRNPILSERVAGLARVLRGNALAALENVALWHERDITHSSVERVIVPDSFLLLDYMLDLSVRVLSGLLVYPQAIAQNLAKTGGLIFSQRVLLALIDRGLSREESYRIVQRHAMTSWSGEGSFRDLLAADPEVTARLTPDELDRLCDPAWFVRHVDRIYDRVLGAAEDRPPGSPTGAAPPLGAAAGEATAGARRR
jgi:adenylosuccinate lyase